jgi:uncharacterized protein YggE
LTLTLSGQSDQKKNENTLLIKGVSVIKQIPEIISATISIKRDSKDYSDCQDKIMDALQKSKSIFAEYKIEENLIKTNEISVSEKIEFVAGKIIKGGYSGSVSLTIESAYTVDFTKKLLGALKKDTLINSYNINFKLSENQKTLLRKKAISMAIDDARDKALSIAEASNVRLVKINSITYRDDEYANGWNIDKDIIKENILSSTSTIRIRGNSSDEPTIDFNPKEIGIQKTVLIEWIIAEK